MHKILKDIIILTLFILLTTFLIWLPYLLRVSFLGFDFSGGFPLIYKNFDGLEYIIIAKTLYFPNLLAAIPQDFPASYFPAHFPGYSLLLLPFAPILGYLKSMVFVSLLFTILSSITFYLLLVRFQLSSQPLWLSIVFTLLPARWVIVRSIGSAETVFIFFTLLAVYFYLSFEESLKYKFLYFTAIAASLAQLTRPPGILLFLALMVFPILVCLKNKQFKNALLVPIKYFPLFLVPLTLVGIFYWFQVSMGDFWAYFHTGDNIHLAFPPFQVFDKNQFWVGDIWLEDIIYIFLLGFLASFSLLKSKLASAGFYVLIYLAATSLVAHRDIARYALPIFPFVLLAFRKQIESREFKITMIVLALGIYFYAQNFLLSNTAPVANLVYFD
ncbi:MAG: hypothetical protein Q7S88_02485 [Candidatus Daviesbacteria bacterium]|nr:hypothetical protein [Candidatus Daviesbacteria bacterium]